MLYMDYIAHIKKRNDLDSIDEIWCITRRQPKDFTDMNGIPVKWVPELSPSEELLQKYLQLKKNQNWNLSTFESIYVPDFLGLMLTKEACTWLNKLYFACSYKNILIVCYCKDVSLCHRKLIYMLITKAFIKMNNPVMAKRMFEEISKYVPEDTVTKFINDSLNKEKERSEIMKSVCFTGHRPKDLYGYNLNNWVPLRNKLIDVCDDLYQEGYRNFITGGAQGVDQVAFWAVNALKQEYSDIRNIVFIPFGGQELRWQEEGAFGQKQYWQMLSAADKTFTLFSKDSNNVAPFLLNRNKAMVNSANVVVGITDNVTSWKTNKRINGGTANCLQYAWLQKKRIFVVSPSNYVGRFIV